MARQGGIIGSNSYEYVSRTCRPIATEIGTRSIRYHANGASLAGPVAYNPAAVQIR